MSPTSLHNVCNDSSCSRVFVLELCSAVMDLQDEEDDEEEKHVDNVENDRLFDSNAEEQSRTYEQPVLDQHQPQPTTCMYSHTHTHIIMMIIIIIMSR